MANAKKKTIDLQTSFQTSFSSEKLMYNQLYDYFDNILFPSQFVFRKMYSAQHCLLVMIEKN